MTAGDEAPPVEARLSRAALIAIGAAGVALVLAIVTVVIVLGRSPPSAAPLSSAPAVIETEAEAAAIQALLVRGAVDQVEGGGMEPDDPGALGLEAGDVLMTLGGRPLYNPLLFDVALRAEIRGRPTALFFEIVRGGERRIARVAVRGDFTPRAARADFWASRPLDPETQEIVDGITKIDDAHYEITRATADKIAAYPMGVRKSVRIQFTAKNGVPTGLKLYAVRPLSVISKLGFANGDLVHAVNKLELRTMDNAMEVYAQVRTADVLVFELTRLGLDQTITITIR